MVTVLVTGSSSVVMTRAILITSLVFDDAREEVGTSSETTSIYLPLWF